MSSSTTTEYEDRLVKLVQSAVSSVTRPELVSLWAERDILKDKLRDLKKGLEKFGSHKPPCKYKKDETACTCGYLDLLTTKE